MSLTAAPDREAIDGYATISLVDKHGFWRPMGQDVHQLNRYRERVTIVGMTSLAFAYAFDFLSMQTIKFVLIFRPLFKQSFDAFFSHTLMPESQGRRINRRLML